MTREAEGFFVSSPFSLVAQENTAACWAGRGVLRNRLTRLVKSWARRPDSTLDLVWANLGAGKSHCLHHLRHLLSEESAATSAIIIELPQGIKSFHELYGMIVDCIDLDAFLHGSTVPTAVSSNMQRAIRAYSSGGAEAATVVREWICARRPHLTDLRNLTGISTRIESDSDAQAALCDLLKVAKANGKRVVLMIDEFQRVSTLPTRTRDAVLSHLRGTISQAGSHLSVVIAAATRAEDTALQLLPAELRTIMGLRPAFSLPSLDSDDALQLVLERFRWFRPPGYSGDEFAPFGRSLTELIIETVETKTVGNLSPRLLLQAFGIAYDLVLDAGATEKDAVLQELEVLRWTS